MSIAFPHKIIYPFYKVLCRYTPLYSRYSLGSGEKCLEIFPEMNLHKWNRNVRLLHLMDITDYWKLRLRPKRSRQELLVNGQWTQGQGFLAINMHWGTGFLSLANLRENGCYPHFVFENSFGGIQHQSYTERKYRTMRRSFYEKVSGDVALSTGGSFDRIVKLVDKGDVPVILFDAPQVGKKASYSLNVLGKRMNLASGVVRLVCQRGLPFQMFRVKIDFETGLRTLDIEELTELSSESVFLSFLEDFFEKNIKESPDSWYFWRQSSEILQGVDND